MFLLLILNKSEPNARKTPDKSRDHLPKTTHIQPLHTGQYPAVILSVSHKV